MPLRGADKRMEKSGKSTITCAAAQHSVMDLMTTLAQSLQVRIRIILMIFITMMDKEIAGRAASFALRFASLFVRASAIYIGGTIWRYSHVMSMSKSFTRSCHYATTTETWNRGGTLATSGGCTFCGAETQASFVDVKWLAALRTRFNATTIFISTIKGTVMRSSTAPFAKFFATVSTGAHFWWRLRMSSRTFPATSRTSERSIPCEWRATFNANSSMESHASI